MKPASGENAGSNTTRPIVPYLSINLDYLYQAKAILETAGYRVTISLDLLQYQVVAIIWHPEKQDGGFIHADELGLLCRNGIAYLNPYGYGGESQARYKDKTNPDRLRHYVQAILAQCILDIETAAPGMSNATLNRAAFVLGRYAYGWQLDPDNIYCQLLTAALNRNIPQHEAEAVIKSGMMTGAKNPRDPHDLETEQGTSQPQNAAQKHLDKLRRKMGGRP